jgi:anti-sigma-K factor RskA
LNDDRKQQHAELEWLAFRYVAGEMTADEARTFEQRLSDDQPAREAVSRAVAISLRLAAARPTVAAARKPAERRPPRVRHRAIRALAWASVGVAASVAILVWSHVAGVVRVVTTPSSKPAVVETSPKEKSIDAVAWMQLRELDDSATRLEFDEWEPDDAPDGEASRDPVVPSWVFELAVANDRVEKEKQND